jgi:quercetin dioxygenase-like cupin family protein
MRLPYKISCLSWHQTEQAIGWQLMSGQQHRPTLGSPAGGMATIRIADEIAQLKKGDDWASGDRRAVSLVKMGPLNIMLLVLKQGARLNEHCAKGPLAVQVVSGSIRFIAGAQHVLCAGESIALDRNLNHSLEALEESAIILTTVTAID